MRATLMYGACDVRVDDVPDAGLIDATDALVRVTRAAICGSDLWPYKSMPPDDRPADGPRVHRVGLVITLLIFKITWDSWRLVYTTDPGEMAEHDH